MVHSQHDMVERHGGSDAPILCRPAGRDCRKPGGYDETSFVPATELELLTAPEARDDLTICNQSPTDRPEHFAHANTAESLVAVWLAGADFTREKTVLGAYGATVALQPRRVIGLDSEVIPVGDGGAIWLLPEQARVRPDRPIVGITFRVRSLREAETVLRQAGVAATTAASGSHLIPPAAAGRWIEFSASAP